MVLVRRTVLRMSGLAIGMPLTAALQTLPRLAYALDYPTRPVRIISGFAAGGGVDITARLIGQWLSERLGQQCIVEDRAGAGGNIGTEVVVNAPPDGYTLLLASAPNTVNTTLYEKLNFDFVRDIAAVAGVIRVPMVVLLNLSVPATTVPEFIAYCKANPEAVNMGSAGIGSAPHMAGELFNIMAGVKMTHVPYRGQAPALADLLGGRIQVLFPTTPGMTEYIRTGKVRALAVTTASRAEVLPELPTVSEFVPGYEASQWYGIGAPKSTPTDIINKLNQEINAAFSDNTMKGRLADLGGEMLPGTPKDFASLIVSETGKWAKVVKSAGLKPE
jgi:tripartite-type tricarboxylate transporter receptor subunit TctC